MKNILFFALVIMSFNLNAQTKKTAQKKAIETNEQKVLSEAKAYFEIYVQSNFKDPYSYKLQKIWLSPNTVGSTRKDLVDDYERTIKKIDTTSFMYKSKEAKIQLKEAILKKNQLDIELASMTDKEKKEIINYTVYVDAYGANSYGNKVLGEYYFTVDKTGKLTDAIRKLK